MTEDRRLKNELVLPDGMYAFTQDTTSGVIKTHTGPLVVNITGQDNPVKFDPSTKSFKTVPLDAASQRSPLVPQGYYCVLWNPAEEGKHPDERDKSGSPALMMGQRINIPGPGTFALWPRQSANVVEGHHLRSNQYLVVRVYDEEAAKANWATSIMKPAHGAEGEIAGVVDSAPTDLIVGKLLIIQGTEVSFYIPPTGLEVVQDEHGDYVREAVTLERMAYCILVDEDGNKRYERGPQVIFPKPTEHFYEMREKKGGLQKIFPCIELNAIQGLHIKVIAPYKEGKREFKEGEELFITGKDLPIYFPRPEHSIIRYDGRAKNYATAVPAGEARYVMERETGKIEKVMGPCMLLPDPRTQVIVRRVLSLKQCNLWYPGNDEVLEYNQGLLTLAKDAPTTRSGVVSEGQIRRSKKMKGFSNAGDTAISAAEASSVSSHAPAVLADEFSRGSTYTQPRTVTLNSKFAGVPTVTIWTGYAVLIVSKSGERRVEIGPQTILLDYDETLEVIEMSTGKPKTTDHLLRTAYLRVYNNKVSDIIAAETKDHVRVSTKLSYQVNFEGGDPLKWFQVENYVKFLCDHIRSVLKAAIRKMTINEFYSRSEEVIRDTLLGVKPSSKKGSTSRPGIVFEENGMHLTDVDVLKVEIRDTQIASLLEATQHEVVRGNIQLESAERQLARDQRLEEIARQRANDQAETSALRAALEHGSISRALKLAVDKINSKIEEEKRNLEQQAARDAVAGAQNDANLSRRVSAAKVDQNISAAQQDQEVAFLQEETKAAVERLQAVEGGFSEALLALGNQDTLVKVAEAMSVQNFMGGKDLPEVVARIFEGTPFESAIGMVLERAAPNGVGSIKKSRSKQLPPQDQV